MFSIIGIDGNIINENRSTKPWNYNDINANNGSGKLHLDNRGLPTPRRPGFPRLFNRERLDEKLVHGVLKIRIELVYENFDETMKHYSISSCPRNFRSLIVSSYSDEDMYRGATAAIGLLTNYEELIDNEDSDFWVEFDDERTIGLHKAILRKNWPYFRRLMNSKMAEACNNKLKIAEHDYEAIKSMLIYVYSGAVRLVDTKATLELFKAAHQYELEELAMKCEQYALKNLSIANVIDCLIVAVKYDLLKLKEACLELLINEKRVNKDCNLNEIPSYDQLACPINYDVYVELTLKFFQEIA